MLSPTITNEPGEYRFTNTYSWVETPTTQNAADETGVDCYFLQHTVSGDRVETDLNGKRIIESLPATAAQLAATFSDNSYYLSPKLIGFYLRLFVSAGIVENLSVQQCQGCSQGCDTLQSHGVELSTAPGISVVIITFNGAAFLAANLESLARQTMPALEIILVDNASSDGSIEQIAQDYPVVTIIRNTRNYHYAKAVNIGVEAASGELVIILNQDIVLAEDFIERLYLRYFAETDKAHVAAVVPQMRFSRLPHFINGIGNFITEKNWGSDNYFGVVDIGQFQTLQYVGSACFGALMVTKAAWRVIGGLDQVFKSFYEDVDWSFRVHVKGYTLLAAPKALVYHAFGGSYPSGMKLTLVVKNRMRFVLKHLKGKIRTLFFTKYLKQDIKNILSCLRHKSFANMACYFKGYLKLGVEIPNLLSHRVKSRKVPLATMAAFFVKCPPFVALANKNLNPVINKHVIRSYYYFTEWANYQYPTEPIVY